MVSITIDNPLGLMVATNTTIMVNLIWVMTMSSIITTTAMSESTPLCR